MIKYFSKEFSSMCFVSLEQDFLFILHHSPLTGTPIFEKTHSWQASLALQYENHPILFAASEVGLSLNPANSSEIKR
jgi:hypothetical protein